MPMRFIHTFFSMRALIADSIAKNAMAGRLGVSREFLQPVVLAVLWALMK
jgi:hypothetical protein